MLSLKAGINPSDAAELNPITLSFYDNASPFKALFLYLFFQHI